MIKLNGSPENTSYQRCLLSSALLGILVAAISIVLLSLAYFVQVKAGFAPDSGSITPPTYVDAFGYVVFAPVVESYLLMFLLEKLEVFLTSAHRVSLCTSLIAGVIHGLILPISFLSSSLSFYLFSRNFFHWRGALRHTALLAVLTPHVVVNAIAIGLQLVV